MILTVDIGNTSIACGLFDNENLVKMFRMPSDVNLTTIDYGKFLSAEIGDRKLSGAIIGSVVEELNNRVQYAILAQYGVMSVILSYKSDMPISLALQNNSEIGADRIANGMRGFELYKKAVIVVDFGTATTFDIVNSKGEFIGGLIAPGVGTQLKSLNISTSKLPEITVNSVDTAIGNNTKDAILAGVVRGTACMIDGMLTKAEEELGEKANIIATGGYCELISKYMTRKFDNICPHLTLEGLRDLFLLNKPTQPVYGTNEPSLAIDPFTD